ncbi:hypothetical protein L0222_11235 [bacterium]|nr:hypothetical protein [bacterium]
MFKIFQCIVFVIASLAFSESLFALKQVNPVRQAPTTINEAGWNTEYPWFSTDGKLFLFTREVPNSEIQRVHVSYIKNRDDVADTPPNQTLPALIVATPKELVPINNKVAPSETIKAIAVCEETAQPQSLTGKWRYLFTLYAAIGPGGVGTEKKIYRAHRINVVVSKTTGEILSMGMAGAYEPATGTDAAGHNETERCLPVMEDISFGLQVFSTAQLRGSSVRLQPALNSFRPPSHTLSFQQMNLNSLTNIQPELLRNGPAEQIITLSSNDSMARRL